MTIAADDPRTYTLSEPDVRGRGCLNVRLHDVQVSSVTYRQDSDSGRLELVQVDTPPEFQRRGHARHALRHLVVAFPKMKIINSPSLQNSNVGTHLVEALRAEGIPIHEFGCFRDGHACRCALEDDIEA